VYNIPTSATVREFDIITLMRYPAGAVRYAKKYNQNPFLINFCPNGWSANKSISHSIKTMKRINA
jgi:hypothetical protein